MVKSEQRYTEILGTKMTILNLLIRATVVQTAIALAIVPLSLGWVMSSTAQAIVNLSAHRAVYDLKLKSVHKRSGIKDLNGRMVIEMTGSGCEGWSVNFRLVNDFQLPRGKNRLVDSRSTSWESGDGKRMSFFEREFIDNKPYAVTRLKVSLDDHKVYQKLPKKKVFEIPAETIFPVTHQQRLIEKARQGVFRDKSVVYDGADHENFYQAITFIGKIHKGKKSASEINGNGEKSLLIDKTYWPVSVSYYLLKEKDQQDTPSQQISFQMYENGVAGDLTIDYGDFAMTGKLTHLDKLPQSSCDK